MDSIWPYLLGVVLFLVGLSLSVGLHELGHLIPAKLFGVKVSKYMIGFGPTLFARKKGETEYGLKLLPLGGYIAMAGMYPPAPPGAKARGRGFFGRMVQDAREVSAESADHVPPQRLFYNLPVWKRIIIMLGGPVMNLLLGLVLFAIVVTAFGQPQNTTTLSTVSPCIESTDTCSADNPDAPAALAGVKAGDTVLAIDGQSVASWNDISSLIRSSRGQTIELTIDRAGTQSTISVTPAMVTRTIYDSQGNAVTDSAGTAKTERVRFLGIAPTTVITPQPIGQAFVLTGQTIAGTATMIVTLPQRLVEVGQAAFGGAARPVDGPMSVVGVGRVAGEITGAQSVPTESKIASLLGILGPLNIALFVFNLIPLLPLDGGHIAGALWEYVRRGWAWLRKRPRPGPVDIARAMPVTFVVVILLVATSAMLIYADIVKPVIIF